MTRIYESYMDAPEPGDLCLYKDGPAHILKLGEKNGYPAAKIKTAAAVGSAYLNTLKPVPPRAGVNSRRWGFCALLKTLEVSL